jgi:hypothetical protein
LASFSGISMVICISRRLAHSAGMVKPREAPVARRRLNVQPPTRGTDL